MCREVLMPIEQTKLRTMIACASLSILLTGHSFCQERPRITGVSHLSVYTSDAAKTEDFYVHDLGAMKGTDPQNAAGVRYYFNPVQFVEVLPLPPASPVNRMDHAAYNTENADVLLKY